MKKILNKIALITVLIGLNSCTTTQVNETNSGITNNQSSVSKDVIEDFQIPTLNEARDLFLMLDFLYESEKNPDLLNEYYISGIVQNHWYQNNITSTFVKSFFRQTENDYLKIKFVNNSGLELSDKNIEKIFKSSLLEKDNKNSSDVYRYISSDGQIDENINYMQITENGLFEGELVFYEFFNNWQTLEIDDESKENLTLIFGGGTNSISSMITKERTNSFDDYNKIITEKSEYYSNTANDVKRLDFTNEGLFEIANADNLNLIISQGEDILGNSEFTASLSMYSEKNKATYTITNFINFSSKNFSYEIKEDIFRQLAYLTTLSYLN